MSSILSKSRAVPGGPDSLMPHRDNLTGINELQYGVLVSAGGDG